MLVEAGRELLKAIVVRELLKGNSSKVTERNCVEWYWRGSETYRRPWAALL